MEVLLRRREHALHFKGMIIISAVVHNDPAYWNLRILEFPQRNERNGTAYYL
jgi:hypothetical protein